MQQDLVFLFDVDNTLLDNDAVQQDLHDYLDREHGAAACKRYWELFEQLRGELGYADYLGALERFRLEDLHDPRILRMANWLIDYPFADRLYPGALEAIRHVQQWGTAAILSDGDAVFQPRKVQRAGIWELVQDRVLIFIHKEEALDDVERFFPARHYVMIDDKLRILHALKTQWGPKVTTVFPRQGHYATDPETLVRYPHGDLQVDRIGDLVRWHLEDFGVRL